MKFIRNIIVILVFALALPLTALAYPSSASASVSGPFKYTWYYNGSGQAYKVFVRGSAGSTYSMFRAYIVCFNGNYSGYYGGWQTQPGPYYGSTATCPSGYATSASVDARY